MNMYLFVMQKLKDILILIKFKISLANSLTSLAGFSLGGYILDKRALFVFLGTFLLAGGASAVNEILEKGYDLFISRTKSRPLPSERMTEIEAWMISAIFFLAGSVFLMLSGYVSLILGISAFIMYSFIYTPLKRITPFSLFVGAIVGAIPPLMGYFAVSSDISAESILLSFFIYTYQLPHTLSLFYIFKEDFIGSKFKTFAYLERSKLKMFMLITLIISLASGIIFSAMVKKFLMIPLGVIAVATLIRTLKDARKIFSDLNIFMLISVISTIIVRGLRM